MTQDLALSILKTGANVFLTGEPGSGKSHTINRYVSFLRSHAIEPAITASTGIAATHIHGMTVHSWSGIGARDYLSEYDLEAIATRSGVRTRLKKAHVLIIDEVSMLSAGVLDMLDQVLCAVRENNLPFGGIQMVLVGDFFQLPPVSKVVMSDDEEQSDYAFHSRAWQRLNPIVCYLEEQYRQDDDVFTKLLRAVRTQEGIDDVHAVLQKRTVRAEDVQYGVPHLYSHNRDVDRINDQEVEKMKGRRVAHEMKSKGSDRYVEALKRGCLSPEVLVIKEGAKVMFTKNDPVLKYVNGTLGEVVSISMDGTPTVRVRNGKHITVERAEWALEDGGKILARITQFPLRLAWAITVHKSQGMTLDAAAVDLSKAFAYGQGYVALSRVRSLSGLHVLGCNRRALEIDSRVFRADERFREQSGNAIEFFSQMATEELEKLQKSFIAAVGGSLKEVAPSERGQETVAKKEKTTEKTLSMVKDGKTLVEIAHARKLKEGTIIDHICELFMKDQLSAHEVRSLVPSALSRALPKIFAAFKRHGTERLTPVHHELKGAHSFNDLKLARLLFSQ